MLPGRAASVQLNAWMRGKGFDSPGFGIEDGWLAMLFGGTPGLLTRAQVRMLVHEGYRHTTLAEVHAIAVNAGWAIQTIVVPQGQLNVPQWDFCEPGIVLAPTRGWHFAIQAGTQRQFNGNIPPSRAKVPLASGPGTSPVDQPAELHVSIVNPKEEALEDEFSLQRGDVCRFHPFVFGGFLLFRDLFDKPL